MHQGVKVNTYGAPTLYYVGARDKYGSIKEADHRGIQARDCHHSFITDRIEEYRGTSVFLPVLDHFRDIQDIINYEKFVMKLASCIGIKIMPDKETPGLNLPFPVQDTKTASDGKTQKINSWFPAQIFDLKAMGAGDIQVVQSNRPGDNFENMMTLIARIAGVGIGLPIELVLLDYHRGNMASVRAALMEARKTFLSHYGTVKQFCQRHYRWKIGIGVSEGVLKPSAKIEKNFWSCDWSEPVWNWLDPLNEIEAEGLQIAYGFKTYEEVAKQRGKDWAQIAVQLGKEQKKFQQEEAKIIIGQPGATVLGEEGLTEKATTKNTNKTTTKSGVK
jgi:capsid protein